MKKIITLLLFTIIHFFCTAQLHEFHFNTDIVFTEDKKFAFVYGSTKDTTFMVIKLDENFDEIAKIELKDENIKFKNNDVKLINNNLYFSGLTMLGQTRIKIPTDLSKYEIFSMPIFEYGHFGKKIIFDKSNDLNFDVNQLVFNNYKIVKDHVYILYSEGNRHLEDDSWSIENNMFYVPKYKGEIKLVKYKINEKIIDNYLFLQYDKIWEHELNSQFKSVYNNKYLSYEEGAYTSHIVGVDESENFITLSLSDAKTKSREIICLDVNTNEIINSIVLNKISNPNYYLPSFSIFYVNNKKNIVMDVGSINNERYIQLYDTKLNKIGTPHVAIGVAKSENDRLHIFESDDKTYYTRKFNSFFPTNYHGQINHGGASPSSITSTTSYFPVSDGPDVLDVIISDTIISTNSFNKTINEKCTIEKYTEFHSPNFIAQNGEFIHLGISHDKFDKKLSDVFLNFKDCNKCVLCEQKKGIDIYTHNYSSNQNAVIKSVSQEVDNNSRYYQSKNEKKILYFNKVENKERTFMPVYKVYLIKMFE